MTKELNATTVVEFLNNALKHDREAIEALVMRRVVCNSNTAIHPHIPVSQEGCVYKLSALGLLNGLLEGNGVVYAVTDAAGKLIDFQAGDLDVIP
jgi:hypothetical protein